MISPRLRLRPDDVRLRPGQEYFSSPRSRPITMRPKPVAYCYCKTFISEFSIQKFAEYFIYYKFRKYTS